MKEQSLAEVSPLMENSSSVVLKILLSRSGTPRLWSVSIPLKVSKKKIIVPSISFK